MSAEDFARFTLVSLASHRLRTVLTALGIAVGIAAVILLTSIGEGSAPLRHRGVHPIRHQPGDDHARADYHHAACRSGL